MNIKMMPQVLLTPGSLENLQTSFINIKILENLLHFQIENVFFVNQIFIFSATLLSFGHGNFVELIFIADG